MKATIDTPQRSILAEQPVSGGLPPADRPPADGLSRSSTRLVPGAVALLAVVAAGVGWLMVGDNGAQLVETRSASPQTTEAPQYSDVRPETSDRSRQALVVGIAGPSTSIEAQPPPTTISTPTSDGLSTTTSEPDLGTESEAGSTGPSTTSQVTARQAGRTTNTTAGRSTTSRNPTTAPTAETSRTTATGTAPLTTAKPTTARPSTAAPTTAAPSTVAPGTAPPTTARPSTAAPTTATPTTAAPTTAAPPRPTSTSTSTSAPVSGSAWEEHFNSLDTGRWRVEHSTYGDGNGERQCYRPDNVRVADGRLVLTAKSEAATCPNGSTRTVTSGMVRSQGLSFSPGQSIEFRVKLTPPNPANQAGLWPAVWSSGWAGSWPRGGELDFLEVMTAEDARRAMFSLHYADRSGDHELQNKAVPMSGYFSDGWHVIRFDYGRNGNLVWFMDGKRVFSVSAADTVQGYPAPFDRTIDEIKINLAIGGRPGPLASGALGSTGATFEVDYIKVFDS